VAFTKFKVAALGVILLAVIVIVLLGINRYRFNRIRHCDDGERYTIDLVDFETHYYAYSVDLSATFANRAAVEAKLNPAQLQQLSESTQEAMEFRKAVVAGFNSCAISKAQYANLISRYQSLDNLARKIDALIKTTGSLDIEGRKELDSLVQQYLNIASAISNP
jgi:hypothetical protein